MVQYQRYYYHNMKKGESFNGGLFIGDEESQGLSSNGYCKRARPKLVSFILIALLSCSLIWAPQFFGFSSTFSLLYSMGRENEVMGAGMGPHFSPCSSISNGTICCDRSSVRTDVCYMKGDIRTHSASSSIVVYTVDNIQDIQHETIRPYTRKWETSVMTTIDNLNLISRPKSLNPDHKCDVFHDVPAVFFSTGGYTGNVYHEFNDGILPLYITSRHLKRRVKFVILEYHNWWMMKYGDILSHLSDYAPVDFNKDNRTHCFPEAIVGLRIHGELTVDSSLMEANQSIRDFRDLLDRAYWPRIHGLIQDEQREKEQLSLSSPSSAPLKTDTHEEQLKKLKLTILSRNGSRAITNEEALVKLAESIGFYVEVVKPDRATELAKIYRSLNSSDVMVGVHGAAMAHFLFLKPSCVFIQVVPLGTEWAAETYYGDPAVKLGLKYFKYRIRPRESSLFDEYYKDDPVLRNPDSVTEKGWEYTKRIYLDKQNVRLDLKRFEKVLVRAYDYSIGRKRPTFKFQSQ